MTPPGGVTGICGARGTRPVPGQRTAQLALRDAGDIRQVAGHRIVDHARHLHAVDQFLRTFGLQLRLHQLGPVAADLAEVQDQQQQEREHRGAVQGQIPAGVREPPRLHVDADQHRDRGDQTQAHAGVIHQRAQHVRHAQQLARPVKRHDAASHRKIQGQDHGGGHGEDAHGREDDEERHRACRVHRPHRWRAGRASSPFRG